MRVQRGAAAWPLDLVERARCVDQDPGPICIREFIDGDVQRGSRIADVLVDDPRELPGAAAQRGHDDRSRRDQERAAAVVPAHADDHVDTCLWIAHAIEHDGEIRRHASSAKANGTVRSRSEVIIPKR